MTFNRNKPADVAATQALLHTPPPAKLKPNWLGHRGGNASIDYELLTGTSMASMERHRKAVKEHLRHLEVEHGLTVVENNGVYKLV